MGPMHRITKWASASLLLATATQLMAARTYTPEQIKSEMGCNRSALGKKSLRQQQKIVLTPLDDFYPENEAKYFKKKHEAMKEGKYPQMSGASIVKSLHAAGVKDAVDLSYRDTPIQNQNLDPFPGLCTAYSLSAIVANMVNNPKVAQISENHLWSHYEEYDMTQALPAAKSNYTTEEAYWPYDSDTPKDGYEDHAHTRITGYRNLHDNVEAAVKVLNDGHPVYLGIVTPSSMYNGDAVVSSCSTPLDGGHAIAIMGYQLDADIEGGGYFIIKNSWGLDNGDQGYQYMPFNICTSGNFDCLMYEITGVETKFASLPDGQTPNPNPAPSTPPTTPPNGYPVGFDSSNISLTGDLHRPWYASKYRLNIALDIPSKQMKYIDSVVYSFSDDSYDDYESTDKDNAFAYKLKIEDDQITVTVTLKLTNGTQMSFDKVMDAN